MRGWEDGDGLDVAVDFIRYFSNKMDVVDRYKNIDIEEIVRYAYSTVDVEVEFTQLYCDMYVEDLKKRGII